MEHCLVGSSSRSRRRSGWLRVAVHVYGAPFVHDDKSWVDNAVSLLTDRHEQPPAVPWSVSDAPRDYITGQLGGIVGIEVVIERIEASAKMSQNKSGADAAGVIAGFAADGNDLVSDLVRHYTGSPSAPHRP